MPKHNGYDGFFDRSQSLYGMSYKRIEARNPLTARGIVRTSKRHMLADGPTLSTALLE